MSDDDKVKFAPLGEVPDVTWDDVGGQEEAKAQMIEAIELPHKHKELYQYYGKRPTKGILLYGPPGCGKTMLGKAAANALATLHGDGQSTGSFFYVKGPEVLHWHVGRAEEDIRMLFQKARSHKMLYNFPAVIFVDEADSVLVNRNNENASRTNGSIVATFLTEMDGMDDSGAVVILATNRPDALDPAVVRDGRIDRKIKVSRPSMKDSTSILHKYLRKVPTTSTAEKMAATTAKDLFSTQRVLYHLQTASGQKRVTLAHTINGGILHGTVDRAISSAIHRDIAKGGKSGVSQADLGAAVDAIDRQCRDLDHSDAISEVAESLGEKVLGIQKIAPVARRRVKQVIPSPSDLPDMLVEAAA